MKKRIDWKRVGWTIGILVFAPIAGLIGSCILEQTIIEFTAWYIAFTIVGYIVTFLFIVVSATIIYLILKIPKIPNFYYHNGEDKK